MARVLGPLAVALADGEVTLASQRERDVLAMLVQRRGLLVGADVLLDQVWRDAAVGLEPTAVHTVVARLRRRVGADVVVTEPGRGYRLGPVGVDEDRYAARWADARTARLAGRGAEAVDALREVLALWRGPVAYDGVSDHLVTAERVRLAESRVAVTEELCRLLLVEPGREPALAAYELAVALREDHPLREEPYAAEMWAAYRLRRPAEALATYRLLRERLRRELGVDPSPELQSLHQQVLDQDPTLEPHPRPSRRASARVPVPLTETVGREAEIQAVLDDVAAGRRLLTITGPGGIGKSRVLHEVGGRLAGDVGYLDLATRSDVSRHGLAVAVAAALDVGEVDAEGLAPALGDRRVTLLLDEAERALEPAADLVPSLLAACPGLVVVATSRIPLQVLGERVVALGPLPCPARDDGPAAVLDAPAVRLFVARLLDLAPEVEVGRLDPALLGEIARRVDGLPLGLVILAGQGATRSVPDLAALLDHPLDAAAVTRSPGPRQRSLRETLAWSVARLGPDERAVFRRLGVFTAVIDPRAARAVASAVAAYRPADIDESLRLLVREGLLQVDRSDDRLRYRMLRTVMDLAVEELDATGEHVACTAAWRRWYAERWRGQPRSDAVLEDVHRLYDDYLDALDGAIAGDPAMATDLLVTMSRYWSFGHLRATGVQWAGRLLEADRLSELDRARVQLSRAMLDTGSSAQSLTDLEAALPVLDAAGRWPDLVSAHMGLALRHSLSGDSARARRCADAAVEVARRVGDERLADALGVLAVVQADAGDAEAARVTVVEATTLLRSISSVAARVAVASNLADALLNAGDSAAALRLVEQVVPVAQSVAGRSNVDFLVATAGWANLLEGRPQPALGLFRSVLVAVRGEVTTSRYAVESVVGAACALVELRDDDAADVLGDARRWLAESGHRLPPAPRGRLDRLADVVSPVAVGSLTRPRDRLLAVLDRYR